MIISEYAITPATVSYNDTFSEPNLFSSSSSAPEASKSNVQGFLLSSSLPTSDEYMQRHPSQLGTMGEWNSRRMSSERKRPNRREELEWKGVRKKDRKPGLLAKRRAIYFTKEPGRTHENIDQGSRRPGHRVALSDREERFYNDILRLGRIATSKMPKVR